MMDYGCPYSHSLSQNNRVTVHTPLHSPCLSVDCIYIFINCSISLGLSGLSEDRNQLFFRVLPSTSTLYKYSHLY